MCFEEVNSIIDKTDVEKVVVVSPSDSMPSIGGIQFGIKHLYKLQNLSEKIKKKLNSKKLVLSKKYVPKKCSDLNISLSIEDEIKKIHKYETPEVICVPINNGSKVYLDWIEEQTQTT